MANPESERAAAWDLIDEELRKRGIYHGLPLGVGDDHITTRSPWLEDILNRLPSQDLKSWEERVPGFYKMWTLHRPWHGRTGFVIVYRYEDSGKLRKVFLPLSGRVQRWRILMDTTERRSVYFTAKSEETARKRLKKALSPQQWKNYLLNDSIPEVGRSGIIYMVRKNRPTLAIRADDRILCALCLHPLAYYTESWAGVMPPSDEMLAHILMIRASEHFFWRKANQIPLDFPNSGV